MIIRVEKSAGELYDQFYWYLKHWLQQLAWPTRAALILVLVNVVLYVFLIAPQQHQQEQNRQAILLQQQENLRAPPATALLTADEELAAFYHFFPEPHVVLDVLEHIFAAAAQENLDLPQADYLRSAEATALLDRYEFNLPIKGNYPGIRRFISQVLQKNPSLALHGVSFGRQGAGEIGVDAQIRFVLYVQRRGQ